jgi:hypothetical protein
MPNRRRSGYALPDATTPRRRTPSRVAVLCSAAVALVLSAGPLAGTAAAAPMPLTAPALSSTNAQVGSTLTVIPGTWVGATTITDEWERCDSSMNCTSTGTTGGSYAVTYADVGKTLKVAETATAADNSTAEQDSNSTSAVPPSNTSPPQIAPTSPPHVGDRLTVTPGSWPGADTVTDTWEDCNATGQRCRSTGVTGTRYTLGLGDRGHTIVVRETATSGGTSATVVSRPTAIVTDPPPGVPVPSSAPSISGTALQGQTLIAATGTWANNPTSYTYQWQDCSGGHGCTAIPGATGPTYTLTAGDVGYAIVVSVRGVNASGTGAAATSAPTGLVQTTSAVSLTAAPGAPVTNQGVTLVATITLANAGAPAGTVEFANRGRPISGCAALSAAPSGQSVTVLCQTSFAAGPAELTATFTPSASSVVLGSTSPIQTLSVGQDSTTTALDVSPRVQVHAATTYTVSVAPGTARGGPIQPSGLVEFRDRGRPIVGCAAQPVLGGGATCTVRYSATGSRSISAWYLGDSNFAASSSAAKAVRVTRPTAKGTITATMQWTFAYSPSYTRVINMVINGVPRGATVQMRCHGGGCPFAKRSTKIGKPRSCTGKRTRKRACPATSRIGLTALFRRRHLRPEAQITIEIRRPRFIGKYYSFTIRARQQPRVRIACLAVDGARPNAGC